jgi:hypothetical protein
VRILFFLRHPGGTRNFESILRLLSERGHQIELAFDGEERANLPGVVAQLCAEYPSIRRLRAPAREPDGWSIIARSLRFAVDYLRYLEPRYRDAHKLRERAAQRAPRFVRRVARWPLVRTRLGIATSSRMLRALEAAVPISPSLSTFIAERRPDIVLVSPLVELGSPLADYVRAARSLKIPTGLCVYSWDNLTNKGLVRGEPDLVTVWNEAQRREAIDLHDVPPTRVVVTGASPYDQWFDRTPSMTREQFCQQVGLCPDRPFVLYVCSSPFIAGHEAGFVLNWVRQLRGSDDKRVRALGVLIRPHPQNASQWQDIDLTGLENVVAWPREGADPSDAQSKADYYDSIYHCAAVMGINTSALIESAIVERPVHTLLAPEFRDTQEGTLHFHHLTRENGGLLHVSATFEEHTQKLGETLTADDGRDEQSAQFVRSFVRPFGLDVPATPRLVAAIEGLAKVQPEGAGAWRSCSTKLLQLALRPVAACRGQQKQRAAVENRLAAVEKRLTDVLPGVEKRLAGVEKRLEDRQTSREIVQDAERAVADLLAGSDEPLIAGPWLGEVGFELLYWIPFLTWAQSKWPELRERLVVVSRGGAQPWYRHITARYIDAFDHFSPEEVSQYRRGTEKQFQVSELDEKIIERARASIGCPEARVLPPSIMFRAFRALARQGAVSYFRALSTFEPMDQLEPDELAGILPDEYVAVKFYFNYSFPDTSQDRDFAQSTLARLTERTNVVLLNTGIRLDDHSDCEAIRSDRLIRIDHLMTPSNNLRLQTIAISRARAFIGTYGGLSYLAPYFGVPSVSFYADAAKFVHHHLGFAETIFSGASFGDYLVMDTRHASLLQLIVENGHVETP